MSIQKLLSAIALLVAIVCFSTWTNAQNDAAKPNDNLRRLLNARCDTLQERVDALEVAFSNRKVDIDHVLRAECDLLDAKLELATQRAQRVAILEEVVTKMRRIEDVTAQLVQSGNVPSYDLMLAKAERLKAEVKLLRVRGVDN